MISISTAQSTGGIDLVLNLLSAAQTDYQYTRYSGVQNVKPGELLRDDDGKVYRYVYEDPDPDATIDLGTTTVTDTTRWRLVDPAKSTYDDLTALGLTNVSSASATAASGLASRNDVRGGAFAWITNETATATGGISVTALETATIRATGNSTAIAHGGSLFDSDKSKGMSFQIATNVMLSGATATVTNSVLKATGGDVTVAADNTSTLEALMKTIVESPSLAIGATLAFNSIGWDSQNILFNLGNALLGLNPGTENAAKTIAKVTGTTISAGGSIAVTANSLASITAVVETSATSITASLTNKASSIAIDVVVAMNRVSTEVKASIESAPTVTGAPSVEAKAGSVSVLATDDASIYSFVDAPVLAVAASADKATGVTVALSISRNEVATDLAASITGVPSVRATGGNITVRATQSSSIDATSTASAVTVALSLGKSPAFSGGGATAVNKIGGNTNATINGGTMTATGTAPLAGAITIAATNSSIVAATVRALAVAIGGGLSGTTPGIAIGVSIARNLIGWSEYGGSSPIQVRARAISTSLNAAHGIAISAESTATITATVKATAVAIAASSDAAYAVSVGGLWTDNKIGVRIEASSDGTAMSAGTGDLPSRRATPRTSPRTRRPRRSPRASRAARAAPARSASRSPTTRSTRPSRRS